MTPVHQLGVADILILVGGFWVVVKLAGRLTARKTTSHGTKLNGPPSDSYIFGVSRRMAESSDVSLFFQEWTSQFGTVFRIPTAFGGHKTILCDPKAINHFYSLERTVYVKSQLGRAIISSLFGRGLLWAEGEGHKRQRKALTPAFSNAAIRRLTSVFYDSTYKLKARWDTIIDNIGDGAIIDVEHWMNLVALDSIGIAGFSHDFRTLDGEYSSVAAAFESLSFEGQSLLSILIETASSQKLRREMRIIATDLLEKTRREMNNQAVSEETALDKSVIGLLLKAEQEDAELHMNQTEVMAQMVPLILHLHHDLHLTRINPRILCWLRAMKPHQVPSLTWALIELAKQPDKQTKLREELVKFGPVDPTWDELVSGLPYLDSVVLEILRLHPPVTETTREAMVDDVLPLAQPVTTALGTVVDRVVIPKGSIVTVPIRSIHRSEAFWGQNAKDFAPERWLTLGADPIRAKEIQGHRHLLTFLEGPRTCLGKSFALAEFKAVLSVLIKNFTFEFPDGPETEIARHRGLVPRPKVVGQLGAQVPMRVRRAE
ncbi:Cytochrome P450 4F12 [Mycena sanguinolenta]|uniref:Cytochrome P450 4F12 n=1 Tax=Mycena sanguinolenta TaxID=230812 RepID=A0A8H7CLW5_9AGAR|nr:Cytochrome P450 4F12 [Mycena sanguinolenta]